MRDQEGESRRKKEGKGICTMYFLQNYKKEKETKERKISLSDYIEGEKG